MGELLVKLDHKVVIMTQYKFNNVMRDKIQNALQVLQQWTEEKGLNISASKTTIITSTRKWKLGGSLGSLKFCSESIKLS